MPNAASTVNNISDSSDLPFVTGNFAGVPTITRRSDCSTVSNSRKYLSFLLLNATSLAKPSAVQLLDTEIRQCSCDIALITESWFTKMHANDIVAIKNFCLFRRDRGHGRRPRAHLDRRPPGHALHQPDAAGRGRRADGGRFSKRIHRFVGQGELCV